MSLSSDDHTNTPSTVASSNHTDTPTPPPPPSTATATVTAIGNALGTSAATSSDSAATATTTHTNTDESSVATSSSSSVTTNDATHGIRDESDGHSNNGSHTNATNSNNASSSTGDISNDGASSSSVVMDKNNMPILVPFVPLSLPRWSSTWDGDPRGEELRRREFEEKKRIAAEAEAKRIADERQKRDDEEKRAAALAEKKRRDPAQAALDLLDTLDKQIAEPDIPKKTAAELKAEAEAEEKKRNADKSQFPCAVTLNEKIVLWRGDICTLAIDAIVSTTNERMNDTSGISGRMFYYGGPELVNECAQSEGCPTGDAMITKGYNLPAKHVIHTVGPRYSLKYQTAAENALHGCYRRSLEVLKDANLSTIAFCVVNTERKGYPRKAAAHIAIRTIRRFLELYGNGINMIILAMDHSADMTIYQQVLPLYFPRHPLEESKVAALLPEDTGNEIGETVIAERKIRIAGTPGLHEPGRVSTLPGPDFIAMPRPHASSTNGSNGNGNGSESKESKILPDYIDSSFIGMSDNPDEVRRRADALKPKAQLEEEEANRVYNRYLRRAKEEDLSDLAKLNFIYQSGVDSSGRAVVVFVASQLPAKPENMDRILLYMLSVLDPIVAHDYNVIYLHALLANHNKPGFAWLKQVFNIFNRKYKKNLKRLFIVHPTFWVKCLFWFANPFVKKKVWKKVKYVPRLYDLYEWFEPKTLVIPEAIHKFDLKENGNYIINGAIGSSADGRDEKDENNKL